MRKKFLLMMLTLLFVAMGSSGKLFATEEKVAQVGGTKYATIDEAIAKWTNGTTLTLLADVTLSDVVTLKSTEHHTLDLGTYTMTAASGKNAIVIKACGNGSSEKGAITITADATNPGGINAGDKCVIYYKYADGGISTEDRPIIYIKGGVFTGSTSSWGTAGIYTIGTAARKCAVLNISGGEFNCTINGSSKNKLIISGGTFHYSVGSQGDQTVYRKITGGRFKSFGFMTNDNKNGKYDKFTIGSDMEKYDVGVYVDAEGYLCVGGSVITELSAKYPAVASNYAKWSSHLMQSSAVNGLYYTDKDVAIAKHGATNVTVYQSPVQINGEGYETLAEAIAEVEEGETIEINGTIEEGSIKLPANLKNVTIKAYNPNGNTRSVNVESGAVLKDMTISAADGNSFNYVGLTFDGITFDNSRLLFTGWRNGDETIENLTVTNCTFKNLNDDTNIAPVHINKDASEAVKNFTFTNNVIDGATGGSKSGIYLQATGDVTITGNTFNNIVFRPALVQLADCDGVADNVVISNNNISNTTRLQVYGTEEGPDQGPWTPAGTDALDIKINNNIFQNITGYYICTWGINGQTDITKNYYDSSELGGKIYWNNEKPADEAGLAALGVFPIYTALNADGTINIESAYEPVALAKIGDKNYYSLQSAINAVKNGGETITLVSDVTEDVTVSQVANVSFVIDGQYKKFDGTITLDGNSRNPAAETLTIQNVNFETSAKDRYFVDANDASVDNRYSHNVTIKNCNFTAVKGSAAHHNAVAARFRQAFNIKIEGGVFTNMHSVLQAYGVIGVEVSGVKTVNSKNGVSFGTSQNAVLKNVEFAGCDGYGVRADAEVNTTLTIENAKIEAFIPVVVRKATHNYNVEFNGEENTMTKTNADGIWFAIGTSEYETNGTMPTAATGNVSVTLNDTGLDVEGIYGYTISGEGTAENPYLIKNINDLIVFRNNVNAGNNYSGKYVKLNADIDLNNKNWTPIGTSSNPFNGTFDGQNNTISNLVINGGSNSDQGFFGRTNDGEIKNVTFNNAKVSGRLNVGVVAGQPYTSKYTNVNVTGHVEVNGMAYVGGVGGKNAYADWTNITVNVDGTSYVQANSVENGTAYRTYVGGVVGFNGEGSHTFKNISSNIKVKGSTKDIGGVFGIAHYNNKFEYITFTGSVEAPEGAKEVGGIAGVWHNEKGTSVTFTNCTSTGTVKVGDVTTTGSIVGGAYNPDNKYEENSGSLIIEGEEAWLPRKVATKAELDAALAAAQDGDIIVMTADIDYGTSYTTINKAITLDLGGKILTTSMSHGSIRLNGGCTLKNGTLNHNGGVAALKVWDAAAIENLVINVAYRQGSTIGGIVIQENAKGVASIKNVTIQGEGLTNGIETYNCGNATENVIGAMENVTINAQGTGMLISAPCGTATNCSISGGTNGIEIWIKGTYSASLDLVNSNVEGGVYAHDEFSSNPDIVNNGTLSFTADEATTGASVEDVTLTIARAEKVIGILKDVMDNAKAKVNDTYYLTLTDAIAAAKAGDVVTVFAGTYAMPSMKAGITIVGEGEVVFNGTLKGTLENLTMRNIHIKGSNAQRWAYAKGNLVFENVTFEATGVYALHFDGITEGTTLTYNNCTIIGWASMGGSPESCIFNHCTFKGNGSYGLIRTFFDATINECTFDVANVNTTDIYQDGIHAVEGATVIVNNCTNVNGYMMNVINVGDTSVVVLDGVEIKNAVSVTIGEKTNYYMTLAEAFAAIDEGAVVIELLDDATMSYGAREAYGVEGTVSVTINGNGNVLTLNQTDSDWSSFGLANENAKVVFNNMTIEKTGKGDTSGAWNTHAIIFSCPLEMTDVTVNNAIAVQDGATLNKVTINEANGYYGLWINGNGQEVAMNGGSITAKNGGRGIKIADQYIDNPAQVTLNVTETVFETAKKAAVLVSSTAGAKITASNVNIEKVAEDNVNFVWVDEDWAANFGNVEVIGASVAQEGVGDFVAAIEKGNEVQAYYKDLHVAMVAAKAGETVVLVNDVNLAGTEWEPVSFKGTFDGKNKIISNLTINKPGVSNTGFIASLNGTFKNVTFTNPNVKGGENTAVVAGRAGGSSALAENITINGTIKVETTHSGYARAAAIVGGWAYGNYKNITVDGGDKANSYIKHTGGGDGRYVAGIVGHADEVNSYVNCTVKNITISGGWLCGGIAGPGPADKSAIGCSVENINMHADYSGGMFGWYYGAGTIENATIKNVTFTDGSTNNGVVGGYGHNTDATVTNLTFENVQNKDGKPLLDHVASIGNNHYFTLADAVSAADNNATINLIWKEGKAPIAMNASLYDKSVTITGTATVDWSKGWLFVGRGGEGDATLTFNKAYLTSASDNSTYGIHVSGREKNTNNKYDGTVVINNSTIELDYLINRGTMTLDNNATLTVKNGFGIAGRPASETESGANATATLTLNNKSKVVVNNHNGMGLGQAANVLEGLGVMNINSGSTFECKQDFLVTANGTMNINGGIVTTEVKITNNGTMNVSGESTLNIASLAGEEINFLDDAIINNSTIGGNVFVAGNVTFRGDNTFNMLYDYGTLTDYYGTTAPMKWTVEKGASLTLTEKARYGLGYGDNVTIIGSIANALEARENLTENERSLFMHGLVAQESKGWNCSSALNIENAYVVIGSNNSFGNKPGNYGGTYTFNIKNSVVDASRITFYEALSTSTFTFDGSDVKMGTFMTNDKDSKFTLKDSKVLSTTTTNGNDEGNYNAGELVLENSSLTYSAAVINTGAIKLDVASTLTAPAISGAGTITIDAAKFVIGGGEKLVVAADMSGYTGTISLDNDDYVVYETTEDGILIKEKSLDGDGSAENPYELETLTELELFRNKVNAGDNYAGKYVKLTADVDLSATRSANNWEPIGTTDNPFMGTFDGNNKVISNLVVEGESCAGLFGKTAGATINNVTIKNANVRGTSYVGAIVGMGYTGTINNCHVTGTIQIEGKYMVGGISGHGYAIIYNSSVIATANSGSYVKGVHSADNLEGDNVGGIVGHCGENNTLTANTVKNITVSGTRKVGGIVGIADMSTDIDACVVENVTIETSASQDYADDNINTMSIGALIGQYQNRGSNGTVTNSTVKNVTFNNVNGVTVNDLPISAGPITGGTRGTTVVIEPTGVTASNNDIYMSTITGSSNLYLMNAVAKIDGVDYYTLQDAFNEGGEVVVLRDITLAETATIPAGKVVTLDLAGYTISQEKACTGNYNMIYNKGTLTIIGNGRLSFKDTGAGDPSFGWGSYTLRNEGTLVVENGTIEHLGEQNPGNGQQNVHMYCAIFQYSGSTTINGGTISTPTYRSVRLWKGDMTINGGTFEGQVWVQAVDNSANLTINGGTFAPRGNDGSSVFVSNSSYDVAFAVTGGTFATKIGANDVEKAGVKGAIIGGLFSQAAKEGTATALIDERFKFEDMPVNGYYSLIQFAGEQTRELANGWSWFSTYIDSETLLQDLKAELNPNGIQIKGQDGYTQFYSGYGANGAWSPGLTSISPTKMYMIRTNDAVEVELKGEFVEENREITLNPGWNWIGYPVRENVFVKDAIRNIVPTHGDVIKSQLMSAVYMYGTWFIPASQYGDFYMNPGEGYMYYSNAVQSFEFTYSKETGATTRTSAEPVEYHWIANAAQYPSNMTVIAMLNIDGKSATDNYEIAAFANGECRGSARPVYVDAIDSYVLVMTISGEEVEELTFKYYDVNNGTEYELSNRVNYLSDAILGTADEPYMFFMNTLGIEESTLDMINIYPNPTTRDRAINLQATCDNVEVFNALGVKVAEYQNVDSIDALETAGIYVIRLTINGEAKNCRLVVK